MSASHSKHTPPEIARRYGVSADKVLVWIRSGELRAVNVATHIVGRPRYVIDDADLAVFEARRTQTPPRRRNTPNVTEYF